VANGHSVYVPLVPRISALAIRNQHILGSFALTGLLLSMLMTTAASRVVNVSSRMHTTRKIAWDDLMSERRYDNWAAYITAQIMTRGVSGSGPSSRGGL
jgi:hypothetical protein